MRQHGLRVPEWRVLATLLDSDGAMITRLAEIALMEQSRLTRIIAQMDQRGLVLRKADADDGRRVRVYLSKKGRQLAQQLVRDAKAHEKRLLHALADTDADHLKPALRALLEHLQ